MNQKFAKFARTLFIVLMILFILFSIPMATVSIYAFLFTAICALGCFLVARTIKKKYIFKKSVQKTTIDIETIKQKQLADEERHRKYIEQEEKRKQHLEQENIRINNYINSIPQIEIITDSNAPKLKRALASEMDEIKFSNITKSTPPARFLDFIVIDVETTGIGLRNRIIEICAMRFESFIPTECFLTYINPKKPIPEEATNINHITDDMVADAPEIHEIAEQLKKFIGKSPIVAHNAEFDIKHLYVSGVDLTSNKLYDTYTIATKKLKKYNPYNDNLDYDVDDYKLDTICDYYGYTRNNSHNAKSDCVATGFIFRELCDSVIDDIPLGISKVILNI